MLYITRKVRDSVIINHDIKVQVISVSENGVWLQIDAPHGTFIQKVKKMITSKFFEKRRARKRFL